MSWKRYNGIILKSIALAILMVIGSFAALAVDVVVPSGPDTLSVVNSTRFSNGNTNGTVIQVEAGNVTYLNVIESFGTKSWAGYYGNISGTIVLNDAWNNSIYNWALASPTGEIYAANASGITWSNIKCVNFTGNITGDGSPAGSGNGWLDEPFNLTSLERFFDINDTDKDGINETFNETFNDGASMLVGNKIINASMRCPLTYGFINSVYQTESFKEVMLHDNYSLIFAALINNSVDSFATGTNLVDFEMLVAENGHPGAEATLTDYYFFVELA